MAGLLTNPPPAVSMSYEIRESDFVVLRAFAHHLSVLAEWDELSECALLYLNKILRCDCICWNEWTPAFTFLKESHVTESHRAAMHSLLPELVHNLNHHPVIAERGWSGLGDQPHRLSDYQSHASFKENPLYQKVYCHLDARHQLAYHFCSTSTTELILLVNRRLRDFSEYERHLLYSAGQLIAPSVNRIHQKDQALRKASVVATLMEQTYGLVNIDTLSPGELHLLKELASGQSVTDVAKNKDVRRDTLSRQLSTAREKLKLNTNKELLATLRSTT